LGIDFLQCTSTIETFLEGCLQRDIKVIEGAKVLALCNLPSVLLTSRLPKNLVFLQHSFGFKVSLLLQVIFEISTLSESSIPQLFALVKNPMLFNSF
jgi:hypothetical protein